MKKLLCFIAAAVAMGLASIVPASALTCSANCQAMNPNTFTGAGGTGIFGDNTVPTGGFTDQFLFELIAPPGTFNTLTDSITTLNHTIAGLTLSIWQCTAGGSLCTSSTQLGENSTPTQSGPVQYITLALNGLPADMYYYVQVTGTSAQATTGYAGTLEVSGTPLPGALPLFASGLGLLGLAGWRKRKKAKLAA